MYEVSPGARDDVLKLSICVARKMVYHFINEIKGGNASSSVRGLMGVSKSPNGFVRNRRVACGSRACSPCRTRLARVVTFGDAQLFSR